LKEFDWNIEKNLELQKTRNISFEEVVFHIASDDLIDVVVHPNSEKYPNQKIFIVSINDYIHYVPFVENETHYFLKTIIPSRKLNRKFS
jgi:uncharacterized DUF497 family protein